MSLADMCPSCRRGLVVGAFGIVLLPLAAKAFATYRGARVANEICAWVNGPATSGDITLAIPPRASAILHDLRARRAPVSCAVEASPHLDSFWTETAVVLRSEGRPLIGLRLTPGLRNARVLGYWSP